MNKTSLYKNSYSSIIFFVLIVFLSGTIYAQMVDSYLWNRLPSDSEINNAKQDLIKELAKNISVNGKVVGNQSPRLLPLIKFHDKKKAGQVPPQDISRMIVFVDVTGIMGRLQ